jgi:opacity protein-like surface antigen
MLKSTFNRKYIPINLQLKEIKMKKSLVLASLLLAGSSAMASDYFGGVNYTNFDLKGTGSGIDAGVAYSETDSEKDKNFSLKVGTIDAEKRIYFQTGKIYNKEGLEYSTMSVNYDKFFQSNGKFTPFIGAGIGYGTMDVANMYDDSGLECGIRIGSLINIDSKSSLEVGYTYGKSYVELNWTDGADSTKLDDLSYKGLYVGYNYKF